MISSSFFDFSLIYAQLTNFAKLSNFWSLFDTAFGSSYDSAKAAGFKSQWQSGNFSQFPQIEIVSNNVLGSAKGAYAISTNKIYLSNQFVSTASQQSLKAVILEEFGHFVDAQVNAKDTPGDEGELFSDLVRGVELSSSELTRIQTENDHTVISINGQQIAVELSDPGNTIATAYNLGALNYSLTPPLGVPLTAKYNDTIRLSDDPNDYYKFTIDKTLGIGVFWTSSGGTPPVYPNLGSTTKLELLRLDGTLVTSQSNTHGVPLSLGQNLDAGTYYLRFNTDSTATVNYDFTLVAGPVDNVGNDSDHAKNLGTLGATPISQSDYVYSIYSGGSSFLDYDNYQFTLSQPSQVTFNLTDGDNSYTSLFQSYGGSPFGSLNNNSSQTSASLVKTLLAGTYSFSISGNGAYNSVTGQTAPASYTIALSAASVPDSGNTIATAYDLGALNYSLTLPLGTPLTTQHDETLRLSDDPNDYYKFTIDKTLGIGINWTSSGGTPPSYLNPGSTTKLELLRLDGTLVTSQSNTYGGSLSLGQNLGAGTYYLRFNTDSTATVNYDFTVVAGPVDNAGNDSTHAKDLGTIGATPISQSDYVYSNYSSGSSFSDSDYYQFTLSQTSQVTFNLTDGDNSYTSLYLSQSNGGTPLASLTNNPTQTSTSSVKTLGAGTYSFYISGNGAYNPATSQSAPASYTIALSAASVIDAGNTIATAYNLGALNYSLTPPLGVPLTAQRGDSIRLSDDPNDYYKFTIDKTLGIGVNWTSSGGTFPVYPNPGSTTKLELLRSDVTLVTSQNSNSFGDSFVGQNLDAGTYYLRFNTDSTANVSYDFTLIAGPVDNAGNDYTDAKDLGTIGATPISQSDYVYSISSGASSFSDYDNYQFTLSQTNQVTFNLTDGDNSYTSLSLFQINGGLTPPLDSLTNNPTQTSASLVKTLGAGTYRIGIGGNGAYNPVTNQSAPASYTITLSTDQSPPPTITLAVSPTSVTEDGTTNLFYTFTRTGTTTNALTVNYGITGTSDASDYTGATPGTGKTITFNPGSATATLTIDPTADALTEPNETVILTLATGTGYTVGTTTGVTGTIINDDTAIETAGNVKFIKDGGNKYFAQMGTATPIAIKNGGQQIYQNIYGGWQPLAAETVNGESQIFWKNTVSNYLHIWRLDSNWNLVSAEGNWAFNSPEAYNKETLFGVDANGDGLIGTVYTTIESAGSTKFVKDSSNKYFAQVGTATPIAIKNGGQQIYQDIYGGWQPLAAETVNGESQILWKNTVSNYLHIWRLDSNWNLVSAEGNWGLNSTEAFKKETLFGVDANGDGYITIESAGSTKFLKNGTDKYFAQVGTATPIAIKNGGQQIYQNIYGGWQPLAAETVNGESQIFWKNTVSNYLHIWRLDSNWNLVSAEGNWAFNSPEAYNKETLFGVDANGDGLIGTVYTTIESAGSTKFVYL